MEITFLGSGSAFCSMKNNFHSNAYILSDSGKRLLIDCGSDIRHSSEALNLTSSDFDAVYISHFHADHVGGLEWLAFTRKFAQYPKKPKLIIHPSMIKPLWNHVLAGGLCSIQTESSNLETYFDIFPLQDDNHFEWEGIQFELVKTVHMYHSEHLCPSYGLFMTHKQHRIFYTTDTQFLPERYQPYYEAASLIFHDCEIQPQKSGVHAHYEDLISLPKIIKNKTWLYHYSTPDLPDAKKEGFLGFVKRAQTFKLSEKDEL